MTHPESREPSATYDDLCQLPDNVVGELIAGELYASPRPAPRHAQATMQLSTELCGPFDERRAGPGGWLILMEPELHLAEHVMVPNIAGWRTERMPRLPEEAWFAVAPDWICEVVSPSTAGLDRVVKLPRYAEHEVAHAWLVDPISRSLEVFRLVEGRWTMVGAHSGSDQVRAEPFDAIEFDLALLCSADEE